MKFTVRQRRDGIYYAEKMYKGKRYYFTSKSKDDVETQLLQFESNKKRNVIINNTPLTIKQWSLEWLSMYKKDVAKRTFDMYKDSLDRYIIPAIRTKKVN